MRMRPGAVMRGAGLALACIAPAGSKRSGILFVAYTGGWFLDKPGLQVLMVVPDTDEPWKRGTVPFATSVASWSTVMLAATTAVRRMRVPTAIGAVVLGGVVEVDHAAGTRDGSAPWTSDTLVMTFSVAKPFAALAFLDAVRDGAVGLDQPVASVWPEYGTAGNLRQASIRGLYAYALE